MTVLADIHLDATGHATFRCPYDETVRAVMKQMPGIQWDPEAKCYHGFEDAMDAAVNYLRGARIVKPRHNVDRNPIPNPLRREFSAGLRRYQEAGLDFLRSRLLKYGAVLLGDDPGLGKTAQVIRALNSLDTGRVLVVCPSIVKHHWRSQILKWSTQPNPRTWTVDASLELEPLRAGNVKPPEWTIVSYDLLKADAKLLGRMHGTIVFDEMHYLMNARSGRAKAAKEVIKHSTYAYGQRPYIIGMTGTPMNARVRDLHNPLDTLFPKRFGSFIGFAIRYCGAYQETIELADGVTRDVWKTDGKSNEAELQKRLSYVMLRREKREVLNELPVLTRNVIPVAPPPAVQKRLQKLSEKLQEHPGADGHFDVGALLSATEEYKLDAAVDLAEELHAEGSHVLLFTNRIEHAKQLAERLTMSLGFTVPWVTGEIDPQKRRERIIVSPVAVVTMKSMTTGIDLTEFDTGIFVGLDYVPSTLIQNEARLHRMGQARGVVFHYLIALGTIDEIIRNRVIDRLETFSEVVGNASDYERMADEMGRVDVAALLKQIAKEAANG